MNSMQNKMMTSAYWVAIAILVMSCASTPQGKKDLLDFLQIGQTTRQDVLDHLGSPSRRYDEALILTYRIVRDRGGLFTEPYTQLWNGVHFSLVLAFDENNLLRKYAMVPVRYR